MGKLKLIREGHQKASRDEIANTLQRSVVIVQAQRAEIINLQAQIRDLGAEPDQQFLAKKHGMVIEQTEPEAVKNIDGETAQA